MNTLPDFNQLLAFQEPKLIKRYQKDYPNNQLSAEKSLQELLKYFWICRKHQLDQQAQPQNNELDFVCALHPEMHEIDDMWHTFLLFTHEYTSFCKTYFAGFIHHIPNTNEEKVVPENYELQLTHYLSYLYDHLGEETVALWFAV